MERPGQHAVLSRMTEVLFVDVLRSWIKSLGPGEGGSMCRNKCAYKKAF
jgi:Cupin